MPDVPVWIHEVDALCRSEIQTDTPSLDTDEQYLAARIMLERVHGLSAIVALHRPIKAVVSDVRDLERILNP